MHKKQKYILAMIKIIAIFVVIFCLTSCGKIKENKKEAEVCLHSLEMIRQETLAHVARRNTSEDKELYIDADVEIGELSNLSEVNLSVDEEKAQAFIDDLIISRYPKACEQINLDGEKSWDYFENGQTLILCSLSDTGSFSYLDVPRNLNSPYLDGEHVFEYGYITQLRPPEIMQSAEEVAQEAKLLLESYSCFDYRVWNVLAGDKPFSDAISGCYYLSMQPVYKGIPISVKGTSSLSTAAVFSKEGIFQIQGIFTLQEVKTKEIEQIVSLDFVLEKLEKDFAVFSEGDKIRVKRIALEYVAEQGENDSYQLIPVWTFECVDSRMEQMQEMTLRYSYMYSAENGKFYGLYY